MKFFRSHRGHPFASSEQIPVVQFRKGQRKDDIMAEHLARFDKSEGVVMLGKAQEKTPVFRTEKRRNPETGKSYPWIVRSTAMINQYYRYCLDQEFGPFPARTRAAAELLRRWLARLPHPFLARDREAGYGYDISILQAEFSFTQVLDRPLHGASCSRKSSGRISISAGPTWCNSSSTAG